MTHISSLKLKFPSVLEYHVSNKSRIQGFAQCLRTFAHLHIFLAVVLFLFSIYFFSFFTLVTTQNLNDIILTGVLSEFLQTELWSKLLRHSTSKLRRQDC